ncbi:MAG: methyltransferase domain-containing protein [Kiritimatiellae bacterium]|nr:methyltransferase domain-containing protein [Kiritimatiellia bacterium]
MIKPVNSVEYNRFGYEWGKYNRIIPIYEKQFLGWVHPFKPSDFKGKRVLDAGCGTGRNTYWPLSYEAKEVVAFDVDPRTVAVAQKNLSDYSNASVVQSSIYDIKYVNEFDVVFSIGVIHHLERPKEAVAKLVRATKPGGTTLVWVYGKEGYTLLKFFINGVRRLTSKFLIRILDICVKPWSFLFYLYLKAWKHKHPYLKLLSQASYWHIHSILFDQLLPETANYWTRAETLDLFDGLSVSDVRINFCNKGSWTVWATKED